MEQFALCSGGDVSTACQLQTFSKNLVDGRYKKLSKWIFGHTHDHIEKKFAGIHFICNPRGRFEDFNRKIYKVKTTDLKSNL